MNHPDLVEKFQLRMEKWRSGENLLLVAVDAYPDGEITKVEAHVSSELLSQPMDRKQKVIDVLNMAIKTIKNPNE